MHWGCSPLLICGILPFFSFYVCLGLLLQTFFAPYLVVKQQISCMLMMQVLLSNGERKWSVLAHVTGSGCSPGGQFEVRIMPLAMIAASKPKLCCTLTSEPQKLC
jgi:hypothetical protein